MFRSKSRRRDVENNLPWEPTLEYGGWGTKARLDSDQTPVVFVHGNGRTASDWTRHRGYLQSSERQEPYRRGTCWAITFSDPATTHDDMAAQLDEFLQQVQQTTGSETIDIVAHSLGVTGVRHWLQDSSNTSVIRRFIGIAGGNSGIPFLRYTPDFLIPPAQRRVASYLHPDTGAVNDLTPSCESVEYYTIRGTRDALFVGNKRSPTIDRAEENYAHPVGHDMARHSQWSMEQIYEILRD